MKFSELRALFLECNPLGRIWVGEDDNVYVQAHSTAGAEQFQGTHDDIARKLGLVKERPAPSAESRIGGG